VKSIAQTVRKKPPPCCTDNRPTNKTTYWGRDANYNTRSSSYNSEFAGLLLMNTAITPNRLPPNYCCSVHIHDTTFNA